MGTKYAREPSTTVSSPNEPKEWIVTVQPLIGHCTSDAANQMGGCSTFCGRSPTPLQFSPDSKYRYRSPCHLSFPHRCSPPPHFSHFSPPSSNPLAAVPGTNCGDTQAATTASHHRPLIPHLRLHFHLPTLNTHQQPSFVRPVPNRLLYCNPKKTRPFVQPETGRQAD